MWPPPPEGPSVGDIMAGKRTRRTFTDADRLSALAALEANGGNVKRTAQSVGISRQLLCYWRDRQKTFDTEKAAALEGLKQGLAERCEALAGLLLEDLQDEEERRQASFRDKATAFGIVVDKMRLLRGEPTVIAGGDIAQEERRSRLAQRYAANRMEDAGGPPAASNGHAT